ncbi:hypothetical protein HYPSUDRAFT_441666 [Hypholoma sublateritium FD-334 SS-4]|uniref:Uncharacterized protein n=1 Tax=Hypholoma sublateritium (strain FD-334 SS-4) TaxID=945553 RepID=A0A0D2Q112_HYPSF|nr:hypothetical protein HYPSUDRAFT_441666 [Hypholoma sublateritium FD-334 SS-4]
MYMEISPGTNSLTCNDRIKSAPVHVSILPQSLVPHDMSDSRLDPACGPRRPPPRHRSPLTRLFNDNLSRRTSTWSNSNAGSAAPVHWASRTSSCLAWPRKAGGRLRILLCISPALSNCTFRPKISASALVHGKSYFQDVQIDTSRDRLRSGYSFTRCQKRACVGWSPTDALLRPRSPPPLSVLDVYCTAASCRRAGTHT